MSEPRREDRFHAGAAAVRQGDGREEFQRDRDRILYSTALRRLGGVTQVAGAAEGHVFHNRLTHTLEVAQLARRLAERANREQTELCELWAGVDSEVCEAAALAHDLGHPPFGHIAEEELNDLIANRLNIDNGFEGNAQTFRVVTRLSVRKLAYPGQDLTRATLNAILKYPRFRGQDGYERKKYGAYTSERDEFNYARQIQPPIAADAKSPEAEIMDWADDIAYAVHDMEDFYRGGFIPLDRLLREDREEAARFIQGTFDRWSAQDFRPVRDDILDDDLQGAFLDLLVQLRTTQTFDEPYAGTRAHRAHLRAMTSALIERYVDALALRNPASGSEESSVVIGRDEELEIAMLKQLTWYYVIQSPLLAAQQHGQRRVIRDLFEILFEASKQPASRDLFPPGAREALHDWLETPGDQSETEVRARVTTDVICSMSEQQAIAMHQQLTGVEPGSILQRSLL